MLPDTSNDPSTSDTHSAVKRLKYSVHEKVKASVEPREVAAHLVHASLGNIDYVGRTDGDENAGVQPCVYALAMYTPGQGKLQLVSVAGKRPFRLETRLSGLVYAPTGAGAEDDAGAREMRRLAAKRLVDEFGSTRRRRQLNAREAGVVAADKISGGEAVQSMLGGVAEAGQGQGLTREEMERRAFSARTVPPHDPAATSAAAAYPLHLLLATGPGAAGGAGAGAGGDGDCSGELGGHTHGIYKLLEDEEELKVARQKELVHAYVLSRLPALASLKSSPDPAAAPRAKLRARYLALLGLLLRAQSKPRLGNVEPSAIGKDLRCRQEGLQGLLLSKFYTRTSDPLYGERYERTDAQKALLLSYILAVAMVAEEGYMAAEDFYELRTALKMDAPKLASAMQQIGCSTKAAKVKLAQDGLVTEAPSFSVSLLRQDPRHPDRTLADCFPAIKLARGKGKGR